MNKILARAVFGAAVLGATGCASIMSGKDQQISVNSNVRGSTVLINGAEVGKTPFIGKVSKPKGAEGNIITLRAEGYEEKTVAVETSIEPTFWVNLLSGGPFGSTTDYSSGAMYKLGDGNFNIDLTKSGK